MRVGKCKVPHFNSLSSDESHINKNYEQNIDGMSGLGQQPGYPYNIYAERRTYKRSENGELIVQIKKNPKVSVRPLSPVRPVTLIESFGSISSSKNTSWYPHRKETSNNYNRCNKLLDDHHPITPIQPFDILPVSIPRIEIDKMTTNACSSRNHCNATSSFYEHSPRSDDSRENFFSQSTHSGSAGTAPSVNSISMPNLMVPLKKIVKESRWVSVHDGRPISPYVRTVAYAPKYSDQEYVMNTCNDGNYYYENRCNIQSKQVTYEDERYSSKADTAIKTTSLYDSCSIFIENPLYRD